MAETKTVVGIDVGDTKIVTLVGEATGVASDGADTQLFDVTGVGIATSKGVKRGQIINVSEATAAMRESLDGAQRSSGSRITHAIMSIDGSHIASQNSHGAVAIGRGDQGVSLEDISRGLEAAQAITVPNNREIIHVIPCHFKVDDQDGVRNPVGMLGYRLEVQAHVVTAMTTSVQNLLKCAHGAGIEVSELVLSSLASAEAVLTPTEREMGVMLVDIGGGTTNIAVFTDGAVWHTKVIDVGAGHFTNDLAMVLRLPMETSERLKVSYGHANPDEVPHDHPLVVSGFGDEPNVTIQRREMAEVLHARAAELFDLVSQEVKRSGYDGLLPAGMVLTGGGSLLAGLRDVARESTQLPVRLAKPARLSGLVDSLNGPGYSSAVGLVDWGMHGVVAKPSKRKRGGFGDWLKNLLPG
jgi:cell division protein FtsA